jgi:hypothetical protein
MRVSKLLLILTTIVLSSRGARSEVAHVENQGMGLLEATPQEKARMEKYFPAVRAVHPNAIALHRLNAERIKSGLPAIPPEAIPDLRPVGHETDKK